MRVRTYRFKDRIRKDGKIKAGNVLKVDSFLNHQMDIKLFGEIGGSLSAGLPMFGIDLTIGLPVSEQHVAAQYFDVPVVLPRHRPEHCRKVTPR